MEIEEVKLQLIELIDIEENNKTISREKAVNDRAVMIGWFKKLTPLTGDLK